MIEKIKNLFRKVVIYKYEFDIKTPEIDKKLMFADRSQSEQFYLFLCGRYIKAIKEGRTNDALELEKTINDFVIFSESTGFYGLTKGYSIK